MSSRCTGIGGMCENTGTTGICKQRQTASIQCQRSFKLLLTEQWHTAAAACVQCGFMIGNSYRLMHVLCIASSVMHVTFIFWLF